MSKSLATTKLSSKGQVVIPEITRNEMGLKAGDQFIVLWQNDYVMLKIISQPSEKEIDAVHKRLRRKAKALGRTTKDIRRIIEKVRSHS